MNIIMNVFFFVNELLKKLNTTLTRILLAILIFFIGFIIGKILGNAVHKILTQFQLNKKLESKNIKINLEHILSVFVSYSIYALTLLYSFEMLNIANTLLYFFSLSLILLILISFFIALIDFIPNLFAGFYLYSKENLKPNTKIKIDDNEGILIKKELLHLVIKTKKQDIIYIPNSTAIKSKIIIK
ncbi:MAG: mechanosensitive ion channel [Candidatus Woesearchaeota archaeon]